MSSIRDSLKNAWNDNKTSSTKKKKSKENTESQEKEEDNSQKTPTSRLDTLKAQILMYWKKITNQAPSKKNSPKKGSNSKPEGFWAANKRLKAESAEQRRKDTIFKSKTDPYGTFGFESLNKGTGLQGDPLASLDKGLNPAEYFKNRTNIKTTPDKKPAAKNSDEDDFVAREGGVASTVKSRRFATILGLPEEDLTAKNLALNAGLPFLLTALTGPINSASEWITGATQDDVKIYQERMAFDNYIKENQKPLEANSVHYPQHNFDHEHRRAKTHNFTPDKLEILESREAKGRNLYRITTYKNSLFFALCYLISQCRAHKGIERGLRKAILEEPLALPLLGSALAVSLVVFKTINKIFTFLPETMPIPRVGRMPVVVFNVLIQASMYILLLSELDHGIFTHSVDLLLQVKKELAENSNATGLKIANTIPHEMRGYKYLIFDCKAQKINNIFTSLCAIGSSILCDYVNKQAQELIGVKAILIGLSSLITSLHTFLNSHCPRTYILSSDLAYLAPETREAVLQQAHSERLLKTMMWAGIAGAATHLSKGPARWGYQKMALMLNEIAGRSEDREKKLIIIGEKLGINTPNGMKNLRSIYQKTKSTESDNKRLKETYVQHVCSAHPSAHSAADIADLARFDPLIDSTEVCAAAIEAAIIDCDENDFTRE